MGDKIRQIQSRVNMFLIQLKDVSTSETNDIFYTNDMKQMIHPNTNGWQNKTVESKHVF